MLCLVGGPVFPQARLPKDRPLTLFTLGGTPVSTDEFLYLFRKNHPRKEDHTEAKVNEYLDLLVAFKAKVTEAKERGYDTTRAFQREFANYREELRKPYLKGNDVLDRLTRQAYERMNLEVRASHLLIGVKHDAPPADTLAAYERIMKFRERILAGEDFATLARTYSEDPSARINAGDLGYFTVLQMVYPFEEAAYTLKTGEISKPVRTRLGYHLIKVVDRRLARGEVEVSHIILRTGTPDDKKVKAKIFEIYTELQGGRAWDELCREYSDDQSTKNSGGRLRPFGVGALAGVPEFEAVAFSLHEPGEVSDPFQSAYGWHIVRLERRIPVPSFESAQESLRRRVSRDERFQLEEEQFNAAKLKSFGYQEQPGIRAQLVGLADSSILRAAWRFRGSKELLETTLFSLRARPYLVSEAVSFVRLEQQPQVLAPSSYMEQLLDRFARTKMEELEEEEIIKTKPEYGYLLNEYREGILLFTIMEKEVWNKATEDSLALHAFYEHHKDKYQAGERVRATLLATEDSVLHTNVRTVLQRGDSLRPDQVKKFRSVQGPRNFAPGESKAVDRVPRTIGLHAIRLDETYYLVQISTLVPPGIRGFAEIRSQVISDYQDHLEKEWVKQLRTKYPAKVNSKGKKYVIQELTRP